ncbi:LmeA family phospholipid-binding protein [Streptomyces abyssomicinicus]|uniref:LmeA family phospholipid-binding protein n=1 Tax=Streptomyces abyssomicinicus TaxID=574929 RepID=UPI00125055FC|nr:DUF2993 domain-containing protein [Streptomyces abyssomicinicus]
MRAVRILLVLVLVIGGLLVAVDRLAVTLAEGRTEDGLKSSQELEATPEVTIHGFPFLTQVAGGELDDVELDIPEFPVSGADGRDMVVEDLDVRLGGVRLDGGMSPDRAATVDGTGLVPYDELLKAARAEPQDVAPGISAAVVGLSHGGDGRIKLKVRPSLLGQELPTVDVLSRVDVQDGRLRVRADALPDLGADIADRAVRSVTDFDQALAELPEGLELSDVSPTGDGVRITVTGEDVDLSGW